MFRAEEILTHLVECFSGIFLEVQHLKKWKIEKHQKKNQFYYEPGPIYNLFKKGIVSK